MNREIVRGVWSSAGADDEDFIQRKHDALVEIYGPGALTTESNSNPVQIVWKFTPASEPASFTEDESAPATDSTDADAVAG